MKEETKKGNMSMEFERKERETSKAYGAFREYLDLGPQRSLVKVAERLGKSKTLIERWSRRYDWPGRVLAYSSHLAVLERQAIEGIITDQAVEWARTQEPLKRQAWREAEDLIAMAHEFKERWRSTKRVPGFESVVRALELAFKLKQFAAGMPSEVKTVSMEVSGKIDVEWEIALRKVYGGAEVVDVEEVGPPGVRAQGSGDGIPTEKTIGNTKGGE